MPDKVIQQRETAEAIARSKAERLFAGSNQPQAPEPVILRAEPTLQQRLADIDRRARERAADEKRTLACRYLNQAREVFQRAVAGTTDEAVKIAYDGLQRLERLTGTPLVGTQDRAMPPNGPSQDGGGRRDRRSSGSFAADAQKLVDHLQQNGPSKAGDAMKASGVMIKPPLNVRTFIEKYLPGTKVKSDGQRASTTYSIA